MISLGAVEANLSQAIGEDAVFVATAVNDDKKGESVVLLVKSELTLSDIQQRIKALNIPPIMLPSEIFLVDEIPLLGSGKIDFKRAKLLATELIN